MIDILYIENKEQLLSEYADVILDIVGEAEREKVFRYRRWQDKQAYLLGKLLVVTLLRKQGYSPKLLKNLSYTKFNRPYIGGIKGDFNISHSGDLVVAAFSDEQMIGVDIEQIQSVDLKDFSYILSEADKKRVESANDKYAAFFKIWSAKEAILKAHGCGLVDNLHEIKVNGGHGVFDNTLYYLKELHIHPDYSSCIAYTATIDKINIEKVLIEDCIKAFE